MTVGNAFHVRNDDRVNCTMRHIVCSVSDVGVAGGRANHRNRPTVGDRPPAPTPPLTSDQQDDAAADADDVADDGVAESDADDWDDEIRSVYHHVCWSVPRLSRCISACFSKLIMWIQVQRPRSVAPPRSDVPCFLPPRSNAPS